MTKQPAQVEQIDREVQPWKLEGQRQWPQARQLRGATSLPAPPPDGGPAELDILKAWETLKKHWRLSAVFAASVIFAVTLVTVLTKPVYAPTARLEIDPPGAELFSMEGRNGGDSAPEYLETQARNLQSEELQIVVLRQLSLDQNPEFTRQGVASRALSAVLTGIEHVPTLLWGRKSTAPFNAPSASGAPRLTSAEATALGRMQGDLSVKRDTASRLVSVTFASHDPVLSATVTNQLVKSFIERNYQTRHDAIMQSTEWLSRQLDDIRTKMEESNRKLADFQRESGIADIDENRSTFTEQMTELSRQKTQAEGERIQIESYLRKVRSQDPATLPQVQSNPVVQTLTQRLGETRAELSQASAIYGPNHPNVRKLQNQAEELESQLRLQRAAILGQMETSFTAALAREHMIDGQMRGTARQLSQMSQYTALKKESQANAELYNALYARVKEAGITAASKSINVRIVDQARVLESPTRPKPLMNLSLGFLVAVVGGVFLAFAREALDNRVHSAADVRRYTGICTVSVVPVTLPAARPSVMSLLGEGDSARPLDGPQRFLVEQPASEQAEAIRSLQTTIRFSQPDHPPQVLLVASSVQGEGKSTVAVNLGIALAHQGKACIVDADLRRPTIGHAFGVTNPAGLGDYLSASASLEGILSAVPEVPGLTVLAAGGAVSDPGALLDSERMRSLLATLRAMFDFILVDSPPILPFADGRMLAPFVDGVIFVGRAGAVTRDAMTRSMEILQEVHSAPILDVVLNAANVKSQPYGYGYGYRYYSAKS
jgi:capsular exopolysaccharide synthesis family protein